MSAAQIVVTLIGGLTVAVLARFFFRSRAAVEAVEQAGVQEVRVVVRGGYSPDVIRARTGLPLRIVFDRQEDGDCSSRVVFFDLALSRFLAPFAETTIEFTPSRPGSYEFACGMNMIHGTVLVEGEPTASSDSPAETDDELVADPTLEHLIGPGYVGLATALEYDSGDHQTRCGHPKASSPRPTPVRDVSRHRFLCLERPDSYVLTHDSVVRSRVSQVEALFGQGVPHAFACRVGSQRGSHAPAAPLQDGRLGGGEYFAGPASGADHAEASVARRNIPGLFWCHPSPLRQARRQRRRPQPALQLSPIVRRNLHAHSQRRAS